MPGRHGLTARVTEGLFRAQSGSRLHFQQGGPIGQRAGASAVLALAGIGGGAFFFAPLFPLLTARHRLVAVDLPGTGRSLSGDVAFSLASWVGDLGDFVARAIESPVVIVGHSLGTILALHAAHAWPGLVHGIIFVGGLPVVRPEIRARLTARVQAVQASIERGPGLRGWGPQVSPGVFSPATFRERPAIVTAFEERFEQQDAVAYLQSIRILLEADATDLIPAVRVPCLAVTGAEDSYAPPDLVRAFAARMPVETRVEVLPGCGHLPFLEAPERFASIIDRFLADTAGP